MIKCSLSKSNLYNYFASGVFFGAGGFFVCCGLWSTAGFCGALWLGSVEGKLNDLWQIYKLYTEQTRSLNDWSPYEHSGCDLKNFKQRMPIFVSLKNEALKERHWKTMIDKTGAGMDFIPITVTLPNIFKMNLLQFEDAKKEGPWKM